MQTENLRKALLKEIEYIKSLNLRKLFNSSISSVVKIQPKQLEDEPKEVQELYEKYIKLHTLLLELYPKWVKEVNPPYNEETLQIVGTYLGVTREAIRLNLTTTFKKLKHPYLKRMLEDCQEIVNETTKEIKEI